MITSREYIIRQAIPDEFEELGKLMYRVYSQLKGFPTEAEQPEYYKMLLHIGELTQKSNTELWAAVSPEGKLAGGVVYISDMQFYGSGGTATKEQ